MDITTITDAENKELGVFIPTELWQKIKQFVPDADQLLSNQSLANLIGEFSIFQLHELSESIISGLKAYYARSIMKEEKNADPALERVKDWETKYEQLVLLQRDGSNFSSREKMEELIVNYAPLLRKQYE